MSTKHGKEEKRRPVVAALATVGLTAATLAATTSPASADDTSATFALTAGTLTIDAPAVADLGGTTAGGGTLTAALGAVTVTDSRGSLVARWTATVSATDFTTGAAGKGEVVPAENMIYVAGTPTLTGTDAVFAPAASLGLSAGQTTIGVGTAVGSNTASWNPTLSVTVPQDAVVGTYTATITHSVA